MEFPASKTWFFMKYPSKCYQTAENLHKCCAMLVVTSGTGIWGQ